MTTLSPSPLVCPRFIGRLGAGDDAPKADAIKEAAQQVIDGAVDDAFPIDIYQTGPLPVRPCLI